MPKGIPAINADEIGNTYVCDEDRFVVSLVAGYSPKRDGVKTPKDAVRAALELTRDDGASDTHWYVFDRKTGEMHMIEQGEVD